MQSNQYKHGRRGGDINTGQPYLVGEKGAELIIPRGNATVIPADITRQITGVAGLPVAPNPIPNSDSHDYDMAGYHAKYGNPKKEEGEHYTDEYKLPDHITFIDYFSKYERKGTTVTLPNGIVVEGSQ